MPLVRGSLKVKGYSSLKGFSLPTSSEISKMQEAGDKQALEQALAHANLALSAQHHEEGLAQAKADIAATKAPANAVEQALMFVASRLGLSISKLMAWRSDKPEDRAYTKTIVSDAISRYGSDLPHYDDGECITKEIVTDFTFVDVKALVDRQHHDFLVEGVSFESCKELVKMCREKRKEAGHAQGVEALERITNRINTHNDVTMTHKYTESRNGTITETMSAKYNRPLPKPRMVEAPTDIKAVSDRITDAITKLIG